MSAALSTLLLATFACGGSGARTKAGKDPVAAEIERSSAFLQSKPATDQTWAQVRQDNQPVLARAEEDLRSGRRLLALQRLAVLRENLAAAAYLSERSAEQGKETAGFEAEWRRMGTVLGDDLGTPAPAAFDDVSAAARALGEAAIPQIRGYYEASLDYGRATMPEQGLYYLASAQGQREVASFFRTLSAPSPRRAPPLRPLGPELDALQAEMLAVYRPPVSIDRHGEFIVASATLKEARELDAAGLRYGALLRYLQAAQQFAPLRQGSPPSPPADALTGRLRELEARLSAGDLDHSLGQLFLESAQAEVAGSPQGKSPANAVTIATDVLPRYFAALEPARPREPRPAPRATVTLVRWPYT